MMPIQIVGPSYQLDTRKADCQRSVNLYPAVMEVPGGKSAAILKSVPGLTLFNTPAREVAIAGKQITDVYGRPLLLKGINAFRWGATTPDDAATHKRWGANCVRLGLRWFGDYTTPDTDCRLDSAPGGVNPRHLAIVEEQFKENARQGLYQIAVLDSDQVQNGNQDAGELAYGNNTTAWPADPGSPGPWPVGRNAWTDPPLVQRFCRAWQTYAAVAKKYTNFYECLPEPSPDASLSITNAQITAFYEAVMDAILVVDPKAVFIIGAQSGYSPTHIAHALIVERKNIVYTADLFDFPSTGDGSDAARIASFTSRLASMTAFRDASGVPVICQQLGVMSSNDPTLSIETAFLQGILGSGLSFTWWCDKDGVATGGYGVRYAATSALTSYITKVPRLQLLISALAQPDPVTLSARGCAQLNGRAFAVIGPCLFEVMADGVMTKRGMLTSSAGPVDMAFNANQLGIVDGISGWYLDLTSNILTAIVATGFYGTTRLAVIDGYGIAIRASTGQFYLSAIDDFSLWDPLDFATAEGSPDNLRSVIASHREAWFLGEKTTEVWDDTGAADFPFERIGTAFIEHGIAGPFAVQAADSTVFWIGEDGIVWHALGYSPQRISTNAVEQKLAESTDLAGTTSFAYQQGGHLFIVFNVPGLDTTWVYDVSSQSWHERAELIDGAYAQHRATCHMYAFGEHIVGCTDGTLCIFDPKANSNNGDVLVRDRISPHTATPTYDMQTFAALQVDCNMGEGLAGGLPAVLMMRYSNDGGAQFGNWRNVSLGVVGQRRARAVFRRMGEARDRVWWFRCTDDVPFTIVGAALR